MPVDVGWDRGITALVAMQESSSLDDGFLNLMIRKLALFSLPHWWNAGGMLSEESERMV